MFYGAESFNQDTSDWDVSNVTNMNQMFDEADDLSDDNKCYIDSSFDSNENWPYDWNEYCFKPENRAELKTAVDEWIEDSESAESTYGLINYWNTRLITNMSELFYDEETFNDDISDWDVSSVTNMKYMFGSADSFNQDISDWDVSSVTDMSYMFQLSLIHI